MKLQASGFKLISARTDNAMWKLVFLSLLAGVEPGSPEARSFSAGASAAHDEYLDSLLPLVVNTWTGDFGKATERAWEVISSDEGKELTVLDAVEQVGMGWKIGVQMEYRIRLRLRTNCNQRPS